MLRKVQVIQVFIRFQKFILKMKLQGCGET